MGGGNQQEHHHQRNRDGGCRGSRIGTKCANCTGEGRRTTSLGNEGVVMEGELGRNDDGQQHQQGDPEAMHQH
jgi:hypothetical protein